ncbi:hypothetical protein NEDG_01572 [Nematocida displodere]|uniref:Uncharacterized protein n=1 Tax=Nematocida displodere TaxID=1805483 RepID=A0A177EJJ1_9MICR|nr:hypothetical protein NEDG_01572 [Nematocida displodere]
MKSKSAWYFGLIGRGVLNYSALCLFFLGIVVSCSGEISPPPYIASPHTEPTIAFFGKSSDGRDSVLETVQVLGQTHIKKKQTRKIYIYLDKHTMESVPEHLVRGIMFPILKITQTNPTILIDPAVFEKILSAFGKIIVNRLELYNLDIDLVGGGEKTIQPGPELTQTQAVEFRAEVRD